MTYQNINSDQTVDVLSLRVSHARPWRTLAIGALFAMALHLLLFLCLAPSLYAQSDIEGAADTETIAQFGYLISRPADNAGSWVISRTFPAPVAVVTITATSDTKVSPGIALGDCVEVESAEATIDTAREISGKPVADCYDDFDDEADAGNGVDDNVRRKWEGTIATVPPLLLGEWSIVIGENTQLTFTTDLKTRFDPALRDVSPTDYTVGRWVEVKVKRQRDGSLLAQHVRVDDYESGQIVVRVTHKAISDTIAAKYDLILTSTLLDNANIYLFQTTKGSERALASRIAREKGVIWAEVNYVNSVPEDDGYKTWGWGGKSEPSAYWSQSAFPQIRLGVASRQYDGSGVVVAVLDTGIYTLHEQFVGKLRLPSLDVIDDDDDASEVGAGLAWGHGTHVAGIIARMAPAATILPVRVLDENGRGNTFLLAYAIEWATEQPGVRVINLSLGTEFDSKILRDVVKRAVMQGIIVVAAAGNNGTNQMQYPAAYQDVIAVTAVDENSVKAAFANYGATWVDLAAPGVGIMSTMINEEGPGYATWSGTSMSTAFVSGAAALMVERWNVLAMSGGMLSQLVNTGLLLDALNPPFSGQIGRLLDVSAVLEVDASLIFMPSTEK